MAVGRSLEITTTPDVCMEVLVDKLKLLDYERDFCKKKKPYRKPLSRLYFAVQDTTGQGQQFFYFASLASWLLSLAGADIGQPKEFDDPNNTCSSILNGCKKLGFASPSYHPSKLTTGHGREICGVLDGLADYVLERRNFTYRKPMYLPDGYQDDDGGAADEGEPGMDGDAATEFPKPTYLEEEEEEAYMMDTDAGLGPAPPGARPAAAASSAPVVAEDKAILASKVDPTAWKLEVERVAPKLRILINADAKDWRSHLEEVQQHTKSITTVWPESRNVLEKLRGDLDSSLDKLQSREHHLNELFERLMQQYRAARTQMQQVQGSYNERTEAITDRNSELHRITEQLSEMKDMMDEQSTNIADATPVMRMKNAIKKLGEELHEIEVRIGVVSHTLLELSVKNKRALQSQAAALSDEDDDI